MTLDGLYIYVTGFLPINTFTYDYLILLFFFFFPNTSLFATSIFGELSLHSEHFLKLYD